MKIATHQNLIKEVLDKLLFERSRREQAVEISAEEFGDEVAKRLSCGWQGRCDVPYISSRGEMKISLRLMTCFGQRWQHECWEGKNPHSRA